MNKQAMEDAKILAKNTFVNAINECKEKGFRYTIKGKVIAEQAKTFNEKVISVKDIDDINVTIDNYHQFYGLALDIEKQKEDFIMREKTKLNYNKGLIEDLSKMWYMCCQSDVAYEFNKIAVEIDILVQEKCKEHNIKYDLNEIDPTEDAIDKLKEKIETQLKNLIDNDIEEKVSKIEEIISDRKHYIEYTNDKIIIDLY